MTRHALPKLAGFLLIAATSLGGGAGAQAQEAAQQACMADYKALCNGVQPGGGRIIACLQQHADKLSPACQKALASKGH